MKILTSTDILIPRYSYESYGENESIIFNTLEEIKEYLYTEDLCIEAYREYYFLLKYLEEQNKKYSNFAIEIELDFGHCLDTIRIEKR